MMPTHAHGQESSAPYFFISILSMENPQWKHWLFFDCRKHTKAKILGKSFHTCRLLCGAMSFEELQVIKMERILCHYASCKISS